MSPATTKKLTVSGDVRSWTLLGHTRQYLECTIPFGRATEFFQARRFNALTGEGEQRENYEAHVKSLRKEITSGHYSPAAFYATISESQRDEILEIDESDDRVTATLRLSPESPLALVDGDHRFSVLRGLLAKYEEEENEENIEQINKLPITLLIYLDGNAKEDFVNLQKGRVVDAAHMLSLKVNQKLLPAKQQDFVKLAFKIADILNTEKESPFYKQLRFDTRSMAGLPISSVCSRGASDIGTSLVGLAKVATAYEKDAAWAAQMFINTFKQLDKAGLDALKKGHMLTPPPEGTKGSATMLVGVTSMIAYRTLVQEKETPDAEDWKKLIEAVEAKLSGSVLGNFAGPHKRANLRELARMLFDDIDTIEFHDGVPLNLVKILSASTFAVTPLPKPEGKKRGRKPKAAQVAVLAGGGEEVVEDDSEQEESVGDSDDSDEVPEELQG